MKLTLASTTNPHKSRPANEDAGVDIQFPKQITVPAGARSFKIDLEVQAAVQNDAGDYQPYLLMPRSSICKTPIRQCNSIGMIDRGYTGNLIAMVDNVSDTDFVLEKALFQVVAPDMQPMDVEFVSGELNRQTTRGAGGFGSTNKGL